MKYFYIFILALLCGLTVSAQSYNLKSPDGNLKLKVETASGISWSVLRGDQPVIAPSRISLTTNGQKLGENPKVRNTGRRSVNEVLKPVVPVKSSSIADTFNELRLEMSGNYSVEFRAYNDGVAYRFVTDLNGDVIIDDEELALNFPENTRTWFPEEESFISHNERTYLYAKLDTLDSTRFCSLPVLMDVSNTKILVTEADLYDYPGMFFSGANRSGLTSLFPGYVVKADPMPGAEDRNEVLTEVAGYIAKTSGKRTFPWRVFVIGDEKELLETNLVYQLSRPLQLDNTDWIKPGMVAWDWYNANNIYGVDFRSGDNTDTYKYYIDFATKYGLEYVILDEGWSRSTTEITAPNAEIDVQELVAYGKERNVGIILWTLWKPLDQDFKNILKQYADWGVKGVKIDFMQRNDQAMVNYYEKIVAEAAKHKLLVDYHGAFKPSGLRRAYPNMISYEGVKGNENNKWSADITPEHNVTLPFTRMVAGPMDYTPGAMVNAQPDNFRIVFPRPMSLGTRAHQVAMYVIYESPLQMLCDAPSAYLKEPEIPEFISRIPTVWEETVALDSKVADYVMLARKSGTLWLVGAMTDGSPRELEMDFSFLPEGSYTLEYLRDGVNADKYAQDYKREQTEVTNQTKMKIQLAPGGGWAGILMRKQG